MQLGGMQDKLDEITLKDGYPGSDPADKHTIRPNHLILKQFSMADHLSIEGHGIQDKIHLRLA